MEQPVKILHIDPDYKVTYLIYRNGASINSIIPLKKAIQWSLT